MSFKKFSALVLTGGLALLGALVPVSAANAWDTWGAMPVQWSEAGTISPTDTAVPFAQDSIFKPIPQMTGATTNSLTVEWDFFDANFAGGFGACTAGNAGAYTCPGGITLQLTQPAGDPYTVASVELVDQTDWSAFNPLGLPSLGLRAATVKVNWTSLAGSDFGDTLTEVHFPANSILLPSASDQEKSKAAMGGLILTKGSAGYRDNRQIFTQYTGDGYVVTSNSSTPSNSEGGLANTGSSASRELTLAIGLLFIGLGVLVASQMTRKSRRS